MRELTNTEFNGLKSLAKNELISQVSIDILGNDLLRVVVVSKPGAHTIPVDALLREIFPSMEYRGTVGEAVNADHYSIDVDGETLINLMMKKTPVWSAPDIVRQEA